MTDARELADVFRHQGERKLWQTEFWGKYMHSAVPYWHMTGDSRLKAAMDDSAAAVLSAQSADGYVGNYPPDARAGAGWDVWGNKYTLLGLLYHHEATGDVRSLEGAKRLADYLIGTFGPDRRSLAKSGFFRGLPSCSVLEPIVWLYRVTRDKRYLDFAAYVVGELDAEYGPRLLRDAEVPVAHRISDGTLAGTALKSYETMSCCQGLLDYADVTGDGRILAAVLRTVESIRRDEVNLAGGSSAGECWYEGARRQTQAYECQQETCVQTTWMRLVGKLLRETLDPAWADELEKTFYNAYLASLSPDGSEFVQYTPLSGTRAGGACHCRLHTNCCNANGPRGFLEFLGNFVLKGKDAIYLCFYDSGTVRVTLPDGQAVELEQFTHYPADDETEIRCRVPSASRFTLALRVPGWSERTVVRVNGEEVPAKAGTFLRLTREWHDNDIVSVSFDMTARIHRQDGHVAFTRGPILLARDRRFGDGDLSEPLQNAFDEVKSVELTSVRPEKGMWMSFACSLPLGTHVENATAGRPTSVRLCDFASAGNTWDGDSFYRTWIPVARRTMKW